MVEKDDIPVCPILGVNIAAIDMERLLDYTQRNIKKLAGNYMCVANVHTTVTAFENEKYRMIQNEAVMAIPDGGPLAWVGKRRGFPLIKRTTGPSYMEEVLTLSVQKGYKNFFYGSTPETIERLREVILERYSDGIIAGTYSPPFRALSAEEDDEIINRINSTKPDFVWVGLGAPKQEYWMASHQGVVQGFMVGVGAGFDYLAGNIKRAPKWMQDFNLEWFYRLMQDPKRLFKRYFVTNTKFIWHAIIRGK